MKKLLVVLMVLAFVAPAMAEDSLTATGSMRVEGYSIDNDGFEDVEAREYWDQRFRLQMAFNPADGVRAVLRADLAEQNWGTYLTRPSNTGVIADSIMVDRAFLSVDKGIVNITGGLNVWNLGYGIVYNNQQPGLQAQVKLPLVVTLGMTKQSENGAQTDKDATEDTDHYWVDLGFKNDMMDIHGFYAFQQDSRPGEQAEPSVFGINYKGQIGPVSVGAEIAQFGGTDAAANDYIGTQFFGDVSMAMSDMLTIGSHIIYAVGTDKTNETQLTAIADSQDVVVQDLILPHHGPGAIQPFGAFDDVFDVGDSQGAIGIGPYVKFKVMDDLLLAAHVIYEVKATDAAVPATEIDSRLFYGVGASWALAERTTLDFGYTGATQEAGSSNTDDYETYSAIGAILAVSF